MADTQTPNYGLYKIGSANDTVGTHIPDHYNANQDSVDAALAENAANITSHTGNSNIHVTAAQKSTWNANAPTASPTFTGTPTAPTAAAGTNTTQIATTAFVHTAAAGKADTASPAFTGTPTAPTAAVGTNTTQIATTAFVANAFGDHGIPTAKALTSSDDLNNLTVAGWYRWVSSVPQNSPTTAGYCGVFVDNGGSSLKQTVIRGPGSAGALGSEWTRYYLGGYGWTRWSQVATAQLAADLTLYVATTGNDSNDGLTAATAKATINSALAAVPFSSNGKFVTILIADGTYAGFSLAARNNTSYLISGQNGADSAVIINAATGSELSCSINNDGSSNIQCSYLTFKAQARSWRQNRLGLGVFYACTFDGALLDVRGPYHGIWNCTFKATNANSVPAYALGISNGYGNVTGLTIESSITTTGVYAAHGAVVMIQESGLTNNATTPYSVVDSSRICVGARTYTQNKGTVTIYDAPTPVSVTGDVTLTLYEDMRQFSMISIYLNTTSNNDSSHRAFIKCTPQEISSAAHWLFSSAGTVCDVRLGLSSNTVYTQIRFISTTASSLYVRGIYGIY